MSHTGEEIREMYFEKQSPARAAMPQTITKGSELDQFPQTPPGELRPLPEGWRVKNLEPRFLIVVHCWFVHSLGFSVEEFVGTKAEAQARADRVFAEANEPFENAAVRLIELQSGERLPEPPRKLTWWERITGRISG